MTLMVTVLESDGQPFRRFFPIDTRTWNEILAYGDVKGKTLEWTFSNMVTTCVRHLDFADRETYGTVRVKSIGPKLRQAFQECG